MRSKVFSKYVRFKNHFLKHTFYFYFFVFRKCQTYPTRIYPDKSKEKDIADKTVYRYTP